jgi:hypothetical protein
MSAVPRLRIGIDFDNTLAGYDHLFRRVACEWRLLPGPVPDGKREIRDAVRTLPEGEAAWMRLQAEVYGRRMGEAELIDGADRFLKRCRARKIDTVVVSHKTRHAAADPDGVDLHETSLAWMTAKGFFTVDGFGMTPAQVFFEPTREAKCGRIAALGCTHFIDDLEEVFREPGFPKAVVALLLARGDRPTAGPFITCPDWLAVDTAVFADDDHVA